MTQGIKERILQEMRSSAMEATRGNMRLASDYAYQKSQASWIPWWGKLWFETHTSLYFEWRRLMSEVRYLSSQYRRG